jgi:hypothetical protein
MKAVGQMEARRPDATRIVVLLAVILGAVVLAALALHRQRYSQSPVHLAVYFIAPGCLLALLAASLFAGRRFRLRLLMSLTSVVIALYAAETVLETIRLPVREAAIPGRAPAPKEGFDTRSKIEVIRDLRARGVEAYPALPGSYCFRFFPEGIRTGQGVLYPFTGISRVMTVQGNELGQYLVFMSDEHGFNNPPGLYRPGDVDVVVLGDSFVRGEHVPPESNAVARVRAAFPKTIGLGSNAIGPWSMLGLLREYGAPLRSRAVVWCYYEGNDLLDVQDEGLSYLTNYIQAAYAQGLFDRQAEIDGAVRPLLEARLAAAPAHGGEAAEEGVAKDGSEAAPMSLARIATLSRIREILGLARGAHIDAAIADYERVLAEASRRVEGWGGTLVFVYLPQWSSFTPLQRSRFLFENYRGEILAAAKRQGLEIVDVGDAFRRTGDPLGLFPFRRPGHYNCEGYRIMGEAIANKLSEHLTPDKKPAP